MFDAYGIASMMGNYKDRLVDHDDYEYGMVDTVEVYDGKQRYETAVEDRRYCPDMVIVEAYDTKEEAQKGHDKWLSDMTTNPPDFIQDCLNSGVAQFAKALGSRKVDKYPRVDDRRLSDG